MADEPKGQRFWPLDARGVEIRKDDQVHFMLNKLANGAILGIAFAIEPARVVDGPMGSQMPVNGELTIITRMTVGFGPGEPIQNALVLKQPPEVDRLIH